MSRLEVGSGEACAEEGCSVFQPDCTPALPKPPLVLQVMPLCSDELNMGSQTKGPICEAN